jgi:ATP-dependent protease Clp ATPase subunit
MNLSHFMRSYAEEIGGQCTEYSPEYSIVIMPVSGGRFQTVIGTIRQSELYNRKLLGFLSKVCPVQPEMDWKMLLEQTAFFNYSRFIISENYVQVEAIAALDNLNEETLKEMLQEVANLADQYEMKLTGADVH